ncbi:MAG: exosortase/archaeosortase family protein [Thermoguttaceae bacterium]
MAAVCVPLFAWAYWPTLVEMVRTWNHEPDYSHGFLVGPLAVFFLWANRDRFPGWGARPGWPGLALIGASIGVRWAGAWYYLDPLDGWSIPLWVAGVVYLCCGFRVFRWAMPAVAFLWFMVPLPFRVERWVSLPLQTVATRLSCFLLQTLGQPAFAQGHTIQMGEHRLEIAQACSGLRIFMGVVALAFAYVILVRRPWWEKAFLIVCAVPIALLVNAGRIVGTGLLYQYVSTDAGKRFSHDAAGWVMIVLAAGLFAGVLWYLGRLVQEVEVVDVASLLRHRREPFRASAGS